MEEFIHQAAELWFTGKSVSTADFNVLLNTPDRFAAGSGL